MRKPLRQHEGPAGRRRRSSLDVRNAVAELNAKADLLHTAMIELDRSVHALGTFDADGFAEHMAAIRKAVWGYEDGFDEEASASVMQSRSPSPM